MNLLSNFWWQQIWFRKGTVRSFYAQCTLFVSLSWAIGGRLAVHCDLDALKFALAVHIFCT